MNCSFALLNNHEIYVLNGGADIGKVVSGSALTWFGVETMVTVVSAIGAAASVPAIVGVAAGVAIVGSFVAIGFGVANVIAGFF